MLSKALIALQLLQLVTGQHYCSTSDTQVNCQPCGGTCNLGTAPCFRCPVQCGKDMHADTCKSVCSEKCNDSICEYLHGQLQCSTGCKNGFTGMYCQEFCPHNCKSGSCDQFRSECIPCRDGDNGENCETTPASNYSSSMDHDEENHPGQNMWLVIGISVGVAATVLVILCIAVIAYRTGVKYGRGTRDSNSGIELRDIQRSAETEDEARDSRIHSYVDMSYMTVNNLPNQTGRCGNHQVNSYEALIQSRGNKYLK